MKKLILAGLILAGISSYSDEVNIRGGINVGSRYSKINLFNSENADDLSYEATVEYLKEITPNVKFGVGTGYQSNPKVSGKGIKISNISMKYEDKKYYDSIPLYITAKYEYPLKNNLIVYVKGNIGYSFNLEKDNIELRTKGNMPLGVNAKKQKEKVTSIDTDIDNGLYYAVGGGIQYKNFFTDLMFQKTFADIERKGTKDSLDYSRVTLGVGYTFGL